MNQGGVWCICHKFYVLLKIQVFAVSRVTHWGSVEKIEVEYLYHVVMVEFKPKWRFVEAVS